MIENNMSYEGFKEYFWEQLKNTLSEGIELPGTELPEE